jgi:hypothetical protein
VLIVSVVNGGSAIWRAQQDNLVIAAPPGSGKTCANALKRLARCEGTSDNRWMRTASLRQEDSTLRIAERPVWLTVINRPNAH